MGEGRRIEQKDEGRQEKKAMGSFFFFFLFLWREMGKVGLVEADGMHGREEEEEEEKGESAIDMDGWMDGWVWEERDKETEDDYLDVSDGARGEGGAFVGYVYRESKGKERVNARRKRETRGLSSLITNTVFNLPSYLLQLFIYLP